jgi:hypothetical protein
MDAEKLTEIIQEKIDAGEDVTGEWVSALIGVKILSALQAIDAHLAALANSITGIGGHGHLPYWPFAMTDEMGHLHPQPNRIAEAIEKAFQNLEVTVKVQGRATDANHDH